MVLFKGSAEAEPFCFHSNEGACNCTTPIYETGAAAFLALRKLIQL